LPTLKRDYVETGKLRYVFRDFPLDSIHPNARKAAEAAHCAGDQGRYWEMHDLLFQNQNALAPEDLRAYAGRLQLDEGRFAQCVSGGMHVGTVQRDQDEGVAAGVEGTPSFILGRTRPDGVVEGTLITGAQPVDDFRQAIDPLLAGNP
jgi:protein-disulfide isomerase